MAYSLKRTTEVWNLLGKSFNESDKVSAAEAIKLSDADFTVSKQPLFAGENKDIHIPGYCATVRDDTHIPLGIVGENYGIVQNHDAFNFVDRIMSDGGASVVSAGALQGGRRVFIVAKFPDPYRIIGKNGDDDHIRDYILFTTSHDGSGAVICMLTPIRVCCMNTLNMALKLNAKEGGINRFSFKHSSNVSARINTMDEDHALSLLNIHNIFKTAMECRLNSFANKQLTSKEVENIIHKTFLTNDQLKAVNSNGGKITTSMIGKDSIIATRTANNIENVMDHIENGVGQNSYRGSALWVLNGITTYFSNGNGSKDDNEKQFSSLFDANGNAIKYVQKVYDLLEEVA